MHFFHNCQHPNNKTYGAFSQQELHQALLRLVRYVQLVCFEDIMDKLTSKRPIPKPFQKLRPFIGKNGLLRVGGRLSRSSLNYDQKFPAILPRKHRLTELIIEEVHKENLHPGIQSLQFLISQNFWIWSLRRAIRHIIYKCFCCFRANPKPFQPPMGDLPSIRVNQVKAFQCDGVDFGGPLFVTLSKSRGVKSQKAYLCWFICMATKALHLSVRLNF